VTVCTAECTLILSDSLISACVVAQGGYGSIGYGCEWDLDEAKKNIMRTHTTAVSARMLYKLANQEGGFTPKKYFSIDRY
jgi:phenylalanyl-tRNA synthetase alpha chain